MPLAQPAKHTLLEALLDTYERSACYEKPAPWPRDVIVRFDERRFADAFAPDGREALDALIAGARALESQSALRVVWPKGAERFVPRQLRLGAAEVDQAYRLAAPFGYAPLADAIALIRARIPGGELLVPDWARTFLDRVDAGLERADGRVLGVSRRDRLKKEQRDIADTVTAFARLAAGEDALERIVSERIFGDSKRLAAIRSRVATLLASADPAWDGVEPDDHAQVLATYGVQRKPALIPCAGCASIDLGDHSVALEDFDPAAYLPEGWTEALVAGVAAAAPKRIITIENEYPFLSYIYAAGGPKGLGERRELVVYIAGFPTPAVVEALRRMHEASQAELHHWGDADVGGLRIWWLLRQRLGEVRLFRTTADWARREAPSGRAMTNRERSALHRLRAQVAGAEFADAVDVQQALELIDTLLDTNHKIEQERRG